MIKNFFIGILFTIGYLGVITVPLIAILRLATSAENSTNMYGFSVASLLFSLISAFMLVKTLIGKTDNATNKHTEPDFKTPALILTGAAVTNSLVVYFSGKSIEEYWAFVLECFKAFFKILF